MRHVRHLAALAAGLLLGTVGQPLFGLLICAVALVGAVITEIEYRSGVPGSATWSGRPPKGVRPRRTPDRRLEARRRG